MVTGDQVETAYCIANSAGFKSNREGDHIMKEIEDPLEIQNQLSEFEKRALNTVLFIDGTTLSHVFESHKEYFFDVACKAPSVVCCRVSPIQKAMIAEALKELKKKTVCCIGDGANDVAMIRACDVGIGIIGKEGKQAALAADYSVKELRDILTLLLWHGRNAYKQTAVMTQFVMSRGLMMTIIQALSTIVFNSVNVPVYNGYFMLAYATIFSIFPVLCLILDSEVSKKVALTYAPLYKTIKTGRELNKRAFLTWTLKSIYQGGVIMLLSTVMFENSYLHMFTITFTALIVVELLNLSSQKNQKILWIYQIAVYILSLIFMKNFIDVSLVTDISFLLKVIGIALISWVPLGILGFLGERGDPSEAAKIQRRARNIQRQEQELL